MLGSLVYGRYADRWPKRNALLGSMAALALATLACGLARNFNELLAARAFAGLMAGPAGAAVMAMAADLVPEERRGQAMGVVFSGYTAASVVGLPLAVFAAGRLGWRPPFVVLALLAAVVLEAARRALPKQAPGERLEASLPPWIPPATQPMLLAWLGVGILMIADFSFVPFLPSLFSGNLGLPKEDLGWCYFAGGLTTLVTFRYAGLLSDRFGSFPVVAVFTVLAASSIFSAFTLVQGPLVLPLAMALMAAIFFCNAPRVLAAFALFSKAPAPERQGAHQSFQNVVQHGVIGATTWLMSSWLAGDDPQRLSHIGRMLGLYSAALLAALPLIWILEKKVAKQA
jgi:predicted MFS family arabinose efflux permease